MIICDNEEIAVESPVYSLEILWAAGAAIAIAGLLLGWFAGRRTSTTAIKYRDVALKLDQVIEDKKAYESEVVEHFTETAKLLNNLTDSYREVHNQLASGAAALCKGEGPISLERAENNPNSAEIPVHLAHSQPPLDYAPKSSPEEKGMLNEEFGLERKPQDLAAEEK